MKEWIKKNKGAVVKGVIILASIIALAIWLWPSSPKPIDAPAVIDSTIGQTLKDQYERTLKAKEETILTQNRQINDFKSRLKVSEAKYETLAKKYSDLEKEKRDVPPPKSNTEIRDRFIALDRTPLPPKQ